MLMIVLLVTGALTLGAVLITLVACMEMAETRRVLRSTRLALVIAEQHAADEEARKDAALKLLDEQRVQRLTEYAEYTARVEALEIQYADALRTNHKVMPFKHRTH